MHGWICLHRSIMNCDLWKEKPFDKRSAWIDLLLMVNHHAEEIGTTQNKIMVKRGEWLTSQLKLSERWGWSRNKVREFLTVLKNEEMIATKSTKKYTIISVKNYDKYQSIQPPTKGTTEGTTKGTTKGTTETMSTIATNGIQQPTEGTTKGTTEGTTKGTQTTSINKSNKINTLSLTPSHEVPRARERKRFVVPSVEEIKAYANEKGYVGFNAETFFNFYDSKDWYVGKNKMTKWKSAVSGWYNRNGNESRRKLTADERIMADDIRRRELVRMRHDGRTSGNNATQATECIPERCLEDRWRKR